MADIRLLVSRLGGGKSLYATRLICRELLESERMIITNVPLSLCNPDSEHLTISEWVNGRSREPLNVFKRIFVLDKLQVGEFWNYFPMGDFNYFDLEAMKCEFVRNAHPRHPARGFKLPYVAHPMEKGVLVPDYNRLIAHPKFRGMLLVIDECHIHFSSRSFYKNIEDSIKAEYFMSQLRRFRADLELISQDYDKVDKNFRRNVTEHAEVVNFGRSRMWMGVTIRGRHSLLRYLQPEMPARGQRPDITENYYLKDENYHKLYYTMATADLTGGSVVDRLRHTGRHWSIWIVAACAVLFLCFFAPHLVQRITSFGATTLFRSVGLGVGKAVAPSAPVSTPVLVAPSAPRVVQSFTPSPRFQIPVSSIECVGRCVMSDWTNMQFLLSDGTVADTIHDDIKWGNQWVLIDGIKYRMRQRFDGDEYDPNNVALKHQREAQ